MPFIDTPRFFTPLRFAFIADVSLVISPSARCPPRRSLLYSSFRFGYFSFSLATPFFDRYRRRPSPILHKLSPAFHRHRPFLPILRSSLRAGISRLSSRLHHSAFSPSI